MRKASLIGACFLAALLAPAAGLSQMLQNPPMLTFTQPVTPQAVQLVQQRLRQTGAYTGAVDGVWGADSQAALERFQQSNGLQVTGQLNQATVAALGIPTDQLVNASWPAVQLTTPIAGGSLRASAVQAIQARLRDLNYYRGPVDGVWGANTQQAIEQFQEGRGLQPNGQLNPMTVAALGLDPKILVLSP
jgi:peptidoglycan hydrolase-like protein with peptidoglycan-binding domain